LEPNENVSLGGAPRVSEREEVFEQLGLLVIGGPNERVLLTLEVEGLGLPPVEQLTKVVPVKWALLDRRRG
jgi:hypothetical protein